MYNVLIESIDENDVNRHAVRLSYEQQGLLRRQAKADGRSMWVSTLIVVLTEAQRGGVCPEECSPVGPRTSWAAWPENKHNIINWNE